MDEEDQTGQVVWSLEIHFQYQDAALKAWEILLLW